MPPKDKNKNNKGEPIQDVLQSLKDTVTSKVEEITTLLTDVNTGIEPRLKTLEKKMVTDPDSVSNKLSTVCAVMGPLPLTEEELPEVGLQDRIVSLENKVSDLEQPLPTDGTVSATQLLREMNELKAEVKFKLSVHAEAVNIIEQKLESHDAKITNNTAKLMANNVKIGGLTEKRDEVPELVVKAFCTNILGLNPGDNDIVEASRMAGIQRRRIGGTFKELPRLMYVKCSTTFRKQIEVKKDMIKGKYDEVTKVRYSIRNHLPDAHYAIRQKYNPWVKEIIENNRKATNPNDRQWFAFKGEEFYIDGQKVVELIKPPPLKAIFELTSDKRAELDEIQFVESRVFEEKGSKFIAYATTVFTAEDVDKCYLKMKKDYLTATHISLGYRIDDDNRQPLQGACSDGEHQVDVKLLDALAKSEMNNVAVFVVRRYGGVRIGGLRLVLAQKAATVALTELRRYRRDQLSGDDDSTDGEEAEEEQDNDATSMLGAMGGKEATDENTPETEVYFQRVAHNKKRRRYNTTPLPPTEENIKKVEYFNTMWTRGRGGRRGSFRRVNNTARMHVERR